MHYYSAKTSRLGYKSLNFLCLWYSRGQVLQDRQDVQKKQKSVGGRCSSMGNKDDWANVIDMLWGNGIKGMSEIPAPCETKIGSDSQTMCVHVNHYGVGQFFFLFSGEFVVFLGGFHPLCVIFISWKLMTLRGWWEKSQRQNEGSNKNWSEKASQNKTQCEVIMTEKVSPFFFVQPSFASFPSCFDHE